MSVSMATLTSCLHSVSNCQLLLTGSPSLSVQHFITLMRRCVFAQCAPLEIHPHWQICPQFALFFTPMFVCSHVEARGRCWLSSSIVLHCIFWDNLFLNLELSSCPDWLASKLLWSSCLGLQARANSPNLLCGCGGYELRSACLPSKHFLYWAVSPAPHLVVVFYNCPRAS